jgi:hypothetical protein
VNPCNVNKSSEAEKSHSDKTAAHPWHVEFTEQQLKAAETLAAEAAIVGGLIVFHRCGGTEAVAERFVPILEDCAPGAMSAARRAINGNKVLEPLVTKEGVELSFSKDARFFRKQIDLISVCHPELGEAHLARNGSRFVQKVGYGNFYDQAGAAIRMPVPGTREVVRFANEHFTSINRQNFRAIEKCIRKGSTEQIDKIPDIFEHVSKL